MEKSTGFAPKLAQSVNVGDMKCLSAPNLLKLLLILPLLQVSTSHAFQIANEFNEKEKQILTNALNLEEEKSWQELTKEQREIGNIGPTIDQRHQWLKKRINWILPAMEKVDYQLLSYGLNIPYPFEDRLPPLQEDNFNILSDSRPGTIRNLSPELYLQGKKTKSLILFRTTNFGNLEKPVHLIPLHSPRAGIISLDQEAIGSETFSSKVPVLSSILFHEARHGDGHAENLGFPHSVCPRDHDYSGQKACDRTSNGAYAISALYFEKSLEACSSCKEGDKEVLRFFQIESQNRVLPSLKRLSLNTLDEIHRLENQINNLSRLYFSETDEQKLNEIRDKIYKYHDEIQQLEKRRNAKQILDPSPEKVSTHERRFFGEE